MDQPPSEEATCKNCHTALQGAYCSQCGQKAISRFNGSLIWNGIHEDLLDVDRGLLRTFRDLWTHPGRMVLAYINGGTRRYYSPVKYLIFWTAIYLVILPWLVMPVFSNQSLNVILHNSASAFTGQSFDDLVNYGSFFMISSPNIYLLCYAPFLAAASYFFHRTSRFNYAETLIMMAYFCGQFSIILLAGSVIPYLSNNAMAQMLLSVVITAPATFYLFFKMQKEFYNDPWLKTILKGLASIYGGSIIYWGAIYLLYNFVKIGVSLFS